VQIPYVKRVPEWGMLVIYRFGRTGPEFVKGPGLRFLMPVADRGVIVDMREQVVAIPRQSCLTCEGEELGLRLQVAWKVVDPLLSQVRVLNFRGAIQGVAATIARSLIAEITVEEALHKQVRLGEGIRERLSEVVAKWGGLVTDVQVVELAKL